MKHKYHTAKVTNLEGFMKNFGRFFQVKEGNDLNPRVIDNFIDPLLLPHEFSVFYIPYDTFCATSTISVIGNKETKEPYFVILRLDTYFGVDLELKFMLDDLKSDKPISIYEHYKNPHNENAVTTQYAFEGEAMKSKFIEMLSPFLKNATEYVKGCKF